jgi:hypothetical protein
MKFELDAYHRGVADAELLSDLKKVASLIGKDRVTLDEYKAGGKYHPSTLQRRFGSWFKALEAAGLRRTRTLGLTEEDYFENLESVWETLGRQPRYAEIRAPLSKYSAGAYDNRFGSWRRALNAFIGWVGQDDDSSSVSAGPAPPLTTESRPVSVRMRFRILERDLFRCVACGRSPATHPGVILHVDHKIPRARGGTSVEGNLQTLCQDCNLGKSDLVTAATRSMLGTGTADAGAGAQVVGDHP